MKPEHRQAFKNLVTKAYADPGSIKLLLSEAMTLLDALEETERTEGNYEIRTQEKV